ncbi:MAG: RNA polymerase sigma factor SigM [Mycobacterium sp.]
MSTSAAQPPDPRSDADLLAAHVSGDPYAFEELFRRHHRQLHRVACRRAPSPEDAADAVQEAMLAAHRGASAFRRQAAVSTWLHRIVVNKCLDQFRGRPPQQPAVLDVAHLAAPDTIGSVDTVLVVRRALAALSADQRAAVAAVDLHGYSIADAARLLGVAEGTVKSRCARGRARLADLLADAAA